MVQASRDISQHVHRALLGYAALTWVGILLVPVFPAGGLSSAMLLSWLTAGASAWAFFRTRNRKCLWAFGLTFPVGVFFAAIVVWLLVSPVACDRSIAPWVRVGPASLTAAL